MSSPLNVVMLDLDRKWTRCGWAKECARIADVVMLLRPLDVTGPHWVESVEVRESWHGFHVVMTLTDPFPSAAALIAAQAAMGSDGRREAMALARVLEGLPRDWNRLFVQKVGGPAVKPRVDCALILGEALRRIGEKPRVKALPLPT